MSKIVEKAFDASKKIVRSIFRGSPNLITTSDLNRQLEALKYQVDKLDEKTGFIIEGANLKYKLENSTLKVDLVYDTMEFKGCSFTPDQTIECSINLTASAPYAYLCLVAEKETVTYDTDTTHEIAGAKFEDGTSMRAADQICYKNEVFVLTHSLEFVENYVGVLAFFRYNNGNVYVNENWTSLYSPLRVMDGSGSVGAKFETSQKYPIKLGDNYDVAFGKINNYLGDSKVYKGTWGYFHQSYDEITEEQFAESMKASPALLTKIGPVYYIRLMGLDMSENEKDTIINNIRWLIFAMGQDAGGCIIFKDIPKDFSFGKLIGASISIKPLIEIMAKESDKVTAQQYVDSIQIDSKYYGRNADFSSTELLSNTTWFTLSSCCGYDGSKFGFNSEISGLYRNSGGINVTLMFADKNIW